MAQPRPARLRAVAYLQPDDDARLTAAAEERDLPRSAVARDLIRLGLDALESRREPDGLGGAA